MIEKKTNQSFAEYGINGFNFAGDFVQTDFVPQLNWPQAGAVYEEMSKNDPTIGAILYMSKQLVRKADWYVTPGGTTPADKEAAEFLQSCLDDMEGSWSEFIGDALTMMIYGWSLHEVVYKLRKGKSSNRMLNSKYDDGRIGWRKLPCRAQRTCYGWEIDQDNGDILALKQQAAPDYQMRIIPLNKAILFKVDNEYGSPFGKSLLRNAYRPWFFKKKIEEIEGVGIERDLAGLPVLIPPAEVNIWDSDDPDMIKLKTASENLVKTIRRDQSEGVVHPNGWELKLLSTGSRRQFDTNQILNRYDQRIAITLLADIVMLGADKVGSFALAEVKKSLLSAALETLLDSVADTINRQEVPRLLDLNGFNNLTSLPKITSDEVETPGVEQLASLIQAMTKSGISVNDPETEAFIRKVASMPALSAEVAELKGKAYKESLEKPVISEPVLDKEAIKVQTTSTSEEDSSFKEEVIN